jgi:signal transduction histidine kinase
VDYSETKKKIEKLRAKGVQDLRKYLLSHQEEFEEYFYCQKVLGVNKACTILWEADSIKELFDGLYPLLKKRPVGWARDIENIVLFSEGQTRVNYDSTEPTLKGNIKNVHKEYCIAPGYENTWGRVFSSFFDITDRKMAEAELQKYQDNLQDIIDERTAQLRMEIEQRKQVENMLQNQIQQRADFIRLLVHEFKTPITNILTSSEILQSGIDETKANFLNNIYQGAVSLNRRVDDMFDIARGEIGMLKCQFDFIDPLPMLFEIVRQMTPNAERKGQSIIVDAPASLPLIYGDIDRLQQVIINLLDNALKFNRRHGNIEIKAGVTGSEFLFSIHDEGEGIPLNEQENLFQPYHRLKRSEDGPEGLGLGLALAKKIVELHRGQIFVSSEKGRGTTFSFKLPLDNDLKAKGPM